MIMRHTHPYTHPSTHVWAIVRPSELAAGLPVLPSQLRMTREAADRAAREQNRMLAESYVGGTLSGTYEPVTVRLVPRSLVVHVPEPM